jgi:hypothetical protein
MVFVIYGAGFNKNSGGPSILYYICKLLLEKNIDVCIYDKNYTDNPYFTRRYPCDHVIDLERTVVIYPEGISGNPLGSKYCVRFIGAPVGTFTNGDKSIINTWNNNDLVYYFNPELKFQENKELIGSVYKIFSIFILHDEIKNYNIQRKYERCVTLRKSYMHKKINYIHSGFALEILRSHSLQECINIFNLCKYFISYDPLTFLNIIAAMCGCISIIYPVDGLNKMQWLQTSAFYPYMIEKKLDNIYGIAYGNSKEEIEWAINTMHLTSEQWRDIDLNYKEKNINMLINDLNNNVHYPDIKLLNTVENTFKTVFKTNIKKIISIKYGIDINKYIDITDEILKQYYYDNKLIIKSDLYLNSIKGDPYPYILKKLYIEYYNKDDCLVTDEYNENRIENINYYLI